MKKVLLLSREKSWRSWISPSSPCRLSRHGSRLVNKVESPPGRSLTSWRWPDRTGLLSTTASGCTQGSFLHLCLGFSYSLGYSPSSPKRPAILPLAPFPRPQGNGLLVPGYALYMWPVCVWQKRYRSIPANARTAVNVSCWWANRQAEREARFLCISTWFIYLFLVCLFLKNKGKS